MRTNANAKANTARNKCFSLSKTNPPGVAPFEKPPTELIVLFCVKFKIKLGCVKLFHSVMPNVIKCRMKRFFSSLGGKFHGKRRIFVVKRVMLSHNVTGRIRQTAACEVCALQVKAKLNGQNAGLYLGGWAFACFICAIKKRWKRDFFFSLFMMGCHPVK